MAAKMATILARPPARQARCAALGFWPGPIDGIDGRRTRAAFEATLALQRAKGLPFEHPSGISRVHWHWTGGGHVPKRTDLGAYHSMIPADGPPFTRSVRPTAVFTVGPERMRVFQPRMTSIGHGEDD